MIIENLASYEHDYAAAIDKPHEILADRYGVRLDVAKQIIKDTEYAKTEQDALIIGQVIGLLMASKNLPVMVHALAIAAGLDQLNGARSEKEVADSLGITRSLLSHYVVGWRDLLSGNQYSFDIIKLRKNNRARSTYSLKTKSPLIAAKNKLRTQIKL